MNTRISHSGIVDSITDGCVRVRILQTSACAACHVSAHCHAAEAKEKIVEVYDVGNKNSLKPGDSVTVYTSGQAVSQALLMGFGVPFLLLVGILSSVIWLTKREGLAALTALAALVPYYLVLYCCRDHIRQTISFHLE